MKRKMKSCPFFACVIIFLICAAMRCIEYFILRTDETVLAENFIHKCFGIIFLFVVLLVLHWKWQDIGFVKAKSAMCFIKGFLLGFGCFTVAYSAEYLIAVIQGSHPRFALYVSGFSITGDQIQQTGFLFFSLCICFNIINVIMEEGIFRGLFITLLENKHPFMIANLLAALLFGIWHWVMPMRNYLDGESSIGNLLLMGLGYIILSGIMSIKWGLLYKMSGSLWIGIGDHLFNNIVATNLLHIVTDSGADEWQIVRVLSAQLISFILVIILYKKKYKALDL